MTYPKVYFKLDQLSPNVRAWLNGATTGRMIDQSTDGTRVFVAVGDNHRLWFWRREVETEAERGERTTA